MLTKILQGTIQSMVKECGNYTTFDYLENHRKGDVVDKMAEMIRDGCSVTDSCGREVKLSHIVVLKNGEISGFISGVRYQSLNALRLRDGKLYISDQSVGGVIGDLNVHNIEKYNDSVTFDSLKIAHTEKVS